MIGVGDLIGLPWVRGAMGPDSYDCWGLAREVQRRLFSRDMPAIETPPESLVGLARLIANSPIRRSWRRSERPCHGAMVEMARERTPWHIGVYLDVDGGGVIHSAQHAGVCFDRVAVLRLGGWRRVTYYEWAGE